MGPLKLMAYKHEAFFVLDQKNQHGVVGLLLCLGFRHYYGKGGWVLLKKNIKE
jgi:hypothetical protein